MIFNSLNVGKHVFEYLNSDGLRVHSIFHKGFNIVNEREEIIFIGTSENGMFPFGVTLDLQTKALLLQDIQTGKPVHFKDNCLYFKNDILKLNGQLIDFKEKMKKTLTFSKEIEKINFKNYDHTDFKEENIKRLLRDLKSDDDHGMLRYFIGRGNGLTPSGDDILVGILFVHTIQPFITNAKISLLNEILKEDCTTLISKQFLKLAIDGVFSSRLIDLFDKNNLAKNVESLLNVGSSSGKDTAYGLFSSLNDTVNGLMSNTRAR